MGFSSSLLGRASRALLFAGAAAGALAGCGEGREGAEETISHNAVPQFPGQDCMVPEEGAGGVRTWTVREGDSLRRIARRVYGDEGLWEAIREANRDHLAKGDVIFPGQVLHIPWEGM